MKINDIPSNTIRGAGGGGGSGPQRTPVEADDNLRSRQIATVLDGLCEGPIYGLVDGLKSIYISETPLQNRDGSFNFKNVEVQFRTGTQNQTAMDGFPTIESPEVFNAVAVRADLPVVKTVVGDNIDQIRVTLSTPNLSTQDQETGDLDGGRIDFRIELQQNGAGYQTAIADAFAGKTTSKYQRSYALRVSGPGPFDIRVVRLTPDSDKVSTQNALSLDSIVKVTDARLNYPNTVMAGVRLDAEYFNAIPTRGYGIRGLLIKVPTNYDPATRTYTGVWDGSFKTVWSDNPAWCYYDLLTAKRYGLGDLIDETQVDKWALYEIAKYCDEYVPDGYGRYEPRFTCNLYLQSREEAFTVVQNLASVFRAITFWGSSTLAAMQDRPMAPINLFTNANVIDGEFQYTGSSIRQRHTVALISYNDPKDFYRQKVEYVADDEAVRELGVIETSLTAFGCSSRGQAHRMGKWLLATERYATEMMSFKCGFDGAYLYPGAIIETSDVYRAMKRHGGRITGYTTNTVTLDAPFDFEDGKTYTLSVMGPEGQIISRPVFNNPGPDTVAHLASALGVALPDNAVFTLSTDTTQTELWRIMGCKEAGENMLEVTCMMYVPGLYDNVELGVNFQPRAISAFKVKPDAPTNLNAVASPYTVDGVATGGIRLTVSWTGSTSTYRYKWRKRGGSWTVKEIGESSFDIENAVIAIYDIAVCCLSVTGIESDYAVLNYTPTVTLVPLAAPANLRQTSAYLSEEANFAWDSTANAQGYVIQVWSGGLKRREQRLGNVLNYSYKLADNKADGGPFRAIDFKVAAYATGFQQSTYASLTVGNPQIPALTGIELVAGIKSALFSCDTPVDPDFAGVLLWASTSSTFTADASTLVFDGRQTSIWITSLADSIPFTESVKKIYVRAAGYDTFGKDSLNISSSIAVDILTTVPGTGTIIADMLYQDLKTRINLIDDGASTPGSVAARIKAEADARIQAISDEIAARNTAIATAKSAVDGRITTEIQDRQSAISQEVSDRGTAISNERQLWQQGDSNLASQISLITAGVAGGFDPGQSYYFDQTDEGWTVGGATKAWSAGFVDVTSSGTDPQFISPIFSPTVLGSQYSVIKARVKRLVGSSAGWEGKAYYKTTARSTFSDSFVKQISMPSAFGTAGDIEVLEWDMSNLTAGGNDWVNGQITQIRLDFCNVNGDKVSVDWVAIGRNAPGASSAALASEQTARADKDNALTTSLNTLDAQVNNATTGLSATRATLLNDYSTTASMNSAIGTQTNAISTRLNSGGDIYNSITTAQTTASSRNATFRQTSTPTALKIGDLWIDTTNGANLLKVATATGTAGWVLADDQRIGATASSMTSLTNTVNDATTGLAKTRSDLLTLYRTTALTDTAISNATTTLSSQVDAKLALTQTYRIDSIGLGATAITTFGIYNPDGSVKYTGGRSWNVLVLNGTSGLPISHTVYDVFGNSGFATNFANDLNALGNDKVVVVYSYDEPAQNLSAAMRTAMIRCGGTSAILQSIAYRNAYILVGIPGSGEGAGIEKYSGTNPGAVSYVLQLVNGKAVGLAGNTAVLGIRATLTNDYYTKADVNSAIATSSSTTQTNYQGYADTKKSEAIAAAQTYTNSYTMSSSSITGAINSSASTLTSNYQAADATTLNSAKTYTDGKVTDMATTAYVQNYGYSFTNANNAIATQVGTVSARLNSGGDVYNSIVAAQNTASTRNATFRQDTAPTALRAGDLWINTSDSNKLYAAANAGANVIAGGAWELAADQRTGTFASSITTLQTRLDNVSGAPQMVFTGSLTFDFTTNVEGWFSTGMSTFDVVGGVLRQYHGSADSYITSPGGYGIVGSTNKIVRASVKRIAGSGWEGGLRWIGSQSSLWDDVKYKQIPDTTNTAGFVTLEWDLSGMSNWTSANISQFRFDFGNTSGDQFQVDWIAVGYNAVGTGAITLEQALTTQTTDINNLKGQYTVKIDNNGKVSGFGLASVANNGVTVSSFIINADRFAISAPGKDDIVPFIVYTENSVSKVGINGALIVSGSITGDRIVANSLDADRIKAGSITADRMNIGFGGKNMIFNSFPTSTTGWYRSGVSGLGWGGAFFDANNWFPQGFNGSVFISAPGTYNSGYMDLFSHNTGAYYPVQPGQRYELSGYISAHRCSVRAVIVWVNKSLAGTGIAAYSNAVDDNEQNQTPASGFGRCGVFGIAPADAAYVYVIFRAEPSSNPYGRGQNNPYMFLSGAYFGEATPNQSVFSAYSPPGGGTVIEGGMIRTDSITTNRLQINTVTQVIGFMAGSFGYYGSPSIQECFTLNCSGGNVTITAAGTFHGVTDSFQRLVLVWVPPGGDWTGGASLAFGQTSKYPVQGDNSFSLIWHLGRVSGSYRIGIQANTGDGNYGYTAYQIMAREDKV